MFTDSGKNLIEPCVAHHHRQACCDNGVAGCQFSLQSSGLLGHNLYTVTKWPSVCGVLCRYQEHGAVPLQVAIKTALAPRVQELLQNEATIYGHMQAAQGFVVPRLVYGGRGVGDRGYILATELIHGEALSDDNASPELCQAALTALRTVHSMGVVHGDLKRSNLLVEGNKVWLIDFSHASAASDADSTIMMEEEEKLMLDLFNLSQAWLARLR